MFSKIAYNLGLVSTVAIIVCCFIPWVHYVEVKETFTGFYVTEFAGGTYYGKAGIVITVLSSVILLFMVLPRLWAKRVNLFLAALLFAYCIRTYILFTGALLAGQVEKKAGIYLIIILSFLILLGTTFPRMKNSKL